MLGLALTSTPAELGVHVLDFGGGALAALAGLPHVGTVADGQQPDLVRRAGRRVRPPRWPAASGCSGTSGITSIAEFRARRAAGDFPDEPATDLLLVVDGYLTLRGEFDELEARLLPIAAKGLSYGLHLAVSANRWSELRPALKDLLGERIELRLGDPLESEVDRRLAAGGAGPARSRSRSPTVRRWCWPRRGPVDPGSTASGLVAADRGGLARCRGSLRCGCCPTGSSSTELPGGHRREPAFRSAWTSGSRGSSSTSPAEPHLLCFGDAECGKTALLRLLAHGHLRPLPAGSGPDRARRPPPHAARSAIPSSHLIGHASTAAATAEAVRGDRRLAAPPAARAGGVGPGAPRAQLVDRAGAVPAGRRLRPGRRRRRRRRTRSRR